MSGWVEAWLVGGGAAVAWVFAAWLVSLRLRDVSVIDAFWGSGFALVTWIYFALADDGPAARGLLVAGLVTVWGLRLSVHIVRRGRGKGEDYRYREMRERNGPRFARTSLFTVFLLQGALIWILSTPLLQAQWAAAPFGALDLVGALCVLVGLFFETVGDLQLDRFRADPANDGRVLRTGLWRYSRHPNYFGDALTWWGFFLFALATPGGAWTIYSPILMTLLLLKVSGVVLLERKLRRTRPEYADYVARTSPFVPWFPRRRPDRGA